MTDEQTSPAVQVAREKAGGGSDVKTLSTGVRVRLKPVAASLVAEAQYKVPLPPVPKFTNPDDGREYPNPDHPLYIAQLEQAQAQRALAANDAAILFAVDLVDEIPDDGWDKKLKLLGFDVDLSDDIAREFAYKKYVAVGPQDLRTIMRALGPSEEDLALAEATFQGLKKRNADS